MRFVLGTLMLAFGLGTVASAQPAATPYTFAATSPASAEICRGVYVFIVTADGQQGNQALYTLRAEPANQNVRAAWLLLDGPTLAHVVTDRFEGDGVALLFVALRDPEQSGVENVAVTVGGRTYANPIAIPAARSTAACRNPLFYGAPRV